MKNEIKGNIYFEISVLFTVCYINFKYLKKLNDLEHCFS